MIFSEFYEENLNKVVSQRLRLGVARATSDWEIGDILSGVSFGLRLKYREKGVRLLGRASKAALSLRPPQ